MNIEEYKNTFYNSTLWFEEEVNKPYHRNRIAKVSENKFYLTGKHRVLDREDIEFKGKQMITRKTIIQYAKSILKFHAGYLLGNSVTYSGDDNVLNLFNEIYRLGNYDSIDYKILDNVNKYGDAYEYIYVDDNGKIKSRVLDSLDSYPIYDDEGNYLAFIEYWTDAYSGISYYNIYYPNTVEKWNNEGGELRLVKEDINVSGLPIHYHNFNDMDDKFGVSFLEDIRPLLDELEDMFSKLGDAIYVNTLNPLPVASGSRIDSSIPADATGYVLNLEGGSEFKVVSTTMDYNNIKFYIESIKNMINEIGCVPSVLSSTEIANISEMSMKMLFHVALMQAHETDKWLSVGMQERFNVWRTILKLKGYKDVDEDIKIDYNLSTPANDYDLITTLKTMKDMGAISNQTVMEQSGLIKDTEVERERIENESKKVVDEQIDNVQEVQ